MIRRDGSGVDSAIGVFDVNDGLASFKVYADVVIGLYDRGIVGIIGWWRRRRRVGDGGAVGRRIAGGTGVGNNRSAVGCVTAAFVDDMAGTVGMGIECGVDMSTLTIIDGVLIG